MRVIFVKELSKSAYIIFKVKDIIYKFSYERKYKRTFLNEIFLFDVLTGIYKMINIFKKNSKLTRNLKQKEQ